MYKLESIISKVTKKTNKTEAQPIYEFKLASGDTKITVRSPRLMFKDSDIGKEVEVQ